MRHRLIPILLFPLLAWAHVASGQPIQLGYAGYVAGLKVFAFHAAADLGGDGYRMQTSYRTSGVLGAFVSGDLHSMAAGSWRPSGPAPLQFQTWGVWRGDPRAVLIDYAGGQPEVRKLLPSIEGERDPVPRAEQANTIDMLSGFAQLARQMNANGRCEANTKLFDGRRLVTVAVTHAGPEILAADSASMFTGQAVRCDIDSRQIAGFAFDSGRDPAALLDHYAVCPGQNTAKGSRTDRKESPVKLPQRLGRSGRRVFQSPIRPSSPGLRGAARRARATRALRTGRRHRAAACPSCR